MICDLVTHQMCGLQKRLAHWRGFNLQNTQHPGGISLEPAQSTSDMANGISRQGAGQFARCHNQIFQIRPFNHMLQGLIVVVGSQQGVEWG